MADAERKFRCWSHFFKQINLDAVGRENFGCRFGKEPAVIAAVMSNGHFYFFVWKTFFKVIGITLGGHAYSIFIHAVGAYTHQSAQSARTKFQVAVKSVDHIIGLVTLHLPDLFFYFFIESAVEPFVNTFPDHCTHMFLVSG